MASLSTKRNSEDFEIMEGLHLVPQGSSPTIAAKDCTIFQITVVNQGSVSATLTVTDGNSNKPVPAVSFAQNTLTIYSWPEGLFCPGGLTWTASVVSTIAAEIMGFVHS